MGDRLTRFRKSRTLALSVVTVAFVLDTLLMTVIVPMLPDLLKRLQELEMPESNTTAEHAVPRLNATESNAVAFNEHTASALTSKIGLLLASKMFFEIIITPVFGVMADRLGYTVPMLLGFFVTFASTLMFAFVESYGLMFVARSLQGIGSGAIFAPGIGLLASKYVDDVERAQAISFAFGGVIFGTLIGPIFGGTMYQWCGKMVTFIILAVVALIDGILRMFIAEPQRVKREEPPSLKKLLSDPYILVVMGGMFFANFGCSILEPMLPAWMMDTMHANSAEQGLAFVPMFFTLLISLNTVNRLSMRVERYWIAILGLLVIGVSIMLIPLAKTQLQLILPTAVMGIGIGLGDCSLLPYLAYLVDLRHKSVYGTVYAINQCIYCLSYMIAATLSGTLEAKIGFQLTLTCVGIVGFLYAPLLYFLRTPCTKDEEKPLREQVKAKPTTDSTSPSEAEDAPEETLEPETTATA